MVSTLNREMRFINKVFLLLSTRKWPGHCSPQLRITLKLSGENLNLKPQISAISAQLTAFQSSMAT